MIGVGDSKGSHTKNVMVVPKSVWGWFTKGRFAFLGSLLAAGDIVILVEEVAQHRCMGYVILGDNDTARIVENYLACSLCVVRVVRCAPGMLHYSPDGLGMSRYGNRVLETDNRSQKDERV